VAVLAPLDVARELGFLARIEPLTQETLELLCVWTGIPYHRCVPKKWSDDFDAPMCDGLASEYCKGCERLHRISRSPYVSFVSDVHRCRPVIKVVGIGTEQMIFIDASL
jgi:hypothetical protein